MDRMREAVLRIQRKNARDLNIPFDDEIHLREGMDGFDKLIVEKMGNLVQDRMEGRLIALTIADLDIEEALTS